MATKYGQEAIDYWNDKKNRGKVYKTLGVAVLIVFLVSMKIYYS